MFEKTQRMCVFSHKTPDSMNLTVQRQVHVTQPEPAGVIHKLTGITSSWRCSYSRSRHFSFFPAYSLSLYTLFHSFFFFQQPLLLIFYVHISCLWWLSLIILAAHSNTASASSHATFHQPQHRLSIHSAVTQERPGLPTSVDEVQSNIRNVFRREGQ